MDMMTKVQQIVAHIRKVPSEHVDVTEGFIRIRGVDYGVVEFNDNSVTLHQFDAKACTFLLA